jgi:monoamine oxidase
MQIEDSSVYLRHGLSRQDSNATIKGGHYVIPEKKHFADKCNQTDLSLEEITRITDRLMKAERQLEAESQANDEITEQLLLAESQGFKQRQELVARNKSIEQLTLEKASLVNENEMLK